jgi:hypothetical protein
MLTECAGNYGVSLFFFVMPTRPVIPAFFVIPAKAGIQYAAAFADNRKR